MNAAVYSRQLAYQEHVHVQESPKEMPSQSGCVNFSRQLQF